MNLAAAWAILRAMICTELGLLRQQATQVSKELSARRQAARAVAASPALRHAPNHDYEWFLERKLHKAAAAIEEHLADHKCQA
jgi:hypothetical protein